MRRVLPGFILVVFAASAATALTPSELLTLIRNRMTGTLAQFPNYTCRETIERKVKFPKAPRFTTTDLLRLEVAYLDNRETFAWPGSPRFGDQSIGDLVPSGAIASGSFGSLARQVFSSVAPVFSFAGQSSINGKKEVEFQFRVPLEKSALEIRQGERSAVVPFHGFFSADLYTGDVIAFEVDAEDIPRELEILETRQLMEYARSRIADADYLLPTSSELTISDVRGDVHRNRTTFEDCHEYKGESTLTFTDVGDIPAATPPPDRPKGLPAGLQLHMKTAVPIQRGVTAIGDTVPAEITEAVHGPVDLPKGALATLRVTRMESERLGNSLSHIISFQLLSVETGGREYDAAGILVHVSGTRHFVWSGDGRVVFNRQELLIRPGLTLTWRTTEPH